MARKPKDEYLEESKELVREYYDNHRMIVLFIREKKKPGWPRGVQAAIEAPEEEKKRRAKIFKRFCKIITLLNGKISFKKYLAFLGEFGVEPDIDQKLEKQIFETALARHKWRRSPMKGVVVAFQKDGKLHLGWSLCNEDAGDTFSKLEAVRKAISRAFPNTELCGAHDLPHSVCDAIDEIAYRATNANSI